MYVYHKEHIRVATDHSSWNSLTFPWQFPDIVTNFPNVIQQDFNQNKLNRVHKTVVLIFLA